MGWIADLLKEIPSAARYKAELEQLEAEHDALKSQNSDLKTQLEAAQREIQRLTAATEQQRSARRSETDENILLLLTNGQTRTSRDIASRIETSPDRAEVLLHALDEDDLVGCRQFTRLDFEAPRPSEWYLTNNGKRYLAQNDLIQ